MRPIVTRFAPSPTGYLHIGGARTALFSWAWARKNGGKFFLRIEDTDITRSSRKHSQAIIDAMNWLDIQLDAPPFFQSDHRHRHQEVAKILIDKNMAYYCYATSEELSALRQDQISRGETARYDRRWRDNKQQPPAGINPSVRFKMPLHGKISFIDKVKGYLSIDNQELDDFIIMRSDGTPTYNLAAVIDDIDMGISHIIRGDDHVMNTYRQLHVFQALLEKSEMPVFAHLPMILSSVLADDGSLRYERMSKRNLAVDIDAYRKEGYLAEALCNYLARLSWGHGDAECFDRDFFVDHFDFSSASVAPARFDRDKLDWLNREHLKKISIEKIKQLVECPKNMNDRVMQLIIERSTTLCDIKKEINSITHPSMPSKILLDEYINANNQLAFSQLETQFQGLSEWSADEIKQTIKVIAKNNQLSFKHLGMPMRILLTGKTDSPDVALLAEFLGKDETLRRLSFYQVCSE